MSPRPIVTVGLALVLAAVRPSPAANDATRRALAQLKTLCDAGLVSPPVCVEKQRAILGLPSTEGSHAAAAASPAQESGIPQELPMGVRITLPAGWTAMPADRVHESFAVLRSRAGSDPGATQLLDRLERQAAGAGVVTFVDGADSLRVSRPDVRPPTDPIQARTFCDRLAQTTTAAASRPLRTYACGPRGQGRDFSLERDALVPGMRSLQAWVTAPDGTAVQLVLSCLAEHADARRRELDGIVASLRAQ